MRRSVVVAIVSFVVTLLGVLGLAVSALGIGWATMFRPPPRMAVPIRCAADAPEIPRGKRIRAVVWNVQYAAGRAHHFFYDGGEAVSVDRPTVERTLDAIAAVIERLDPDLVLLQEVDRDSRRTAFVDQHAELLRRIPFPCDVSTPYHRAPYVPFPSHEHLGRVDMHLSVLSRYKIDAATRHQLALLQESWLRRQFNLRRALLEVRLPLAGGGSLFAFDTHLSAFSRGDGTLDRQIRTIETRLGESETAGDAWILGADLNTLPPSDDPMRLGADAELYRGGSKVGPLLVRYHWPVPTSELQADPRPWYTYLPYGAAAPDRTIDYVLHGDGVRTHAFGVVSDVLEVSDHLPLVLDFEVR